MFPYTLYSNWYKTRIVPLLKYNITTVVLKIYGYRGKICLLVNTLYFMTNHKKWSLSTKKVINYKRIEGVLIKVHNLLNLHFPEEKQNLDYNNNQKWIRI